MRKQWIAEAVYLIGALACIGLCIGGGKEQEKEVFGTSVTGTPAPEATGTPEVPVTQEDTSTQIPGDEDAQNSLTTQTPEATSAPVQDTIPTPMPGKTDATSTSGALDDSQNPEATPGTQENSQSQVSGEDEEQADTPGKLPGAKEIRNENYEEMNNEGTEWWFRRNENHKPSGSGEAFPIGEYSAYYLDKQVEDGDKVIYITFDCGYENGFTPSILDTLAEKNVKAMFFVTRDFIVKNPEYVKRMKDEGHLVGNHTVRHLASSSLTPEELAAELYDVAVTMEEKTGYTIDPFFRPPMGEYSRRVLQVIQDMGYTSVFWSIAYYDYDVNDQPGKAYVVDHFKDYHHNGSIVLMHNTSESNAEALGDVLDLLGKEGYRFGTLTELKK